MSEKEIEKRQIFQNKNGAELAKKMTAYFKKYTIPEMQEAEKKNPKPAIESLDPLSIFDGGVFLPANMRN